MSVLYSKPCARTIIFQVNNIGYVGSHPTHRDTERASYIKTSKMPKVIAVGNIAVKEEDMSIYNSLNTKVYDSTISSVRFSKARLHLGLVNGCYLHLFRDA
jgi:hypothetical protein